MLLYLILVCIASAIVPFLSGRIDWEYPDKQALILKMGRMIRAYNQSGNSDYLQVAQVIAHELQKAGVRISAATQSKLMGV
jgi:hypothetical protein